MNESKVKGGRPSCRHADHFHRPQPFFSNTITKSHKNESNKKDIALGKWEGGGSGQ